MTFDPTLVRTVRDGDVLMVQLPADLLAVVMTGATLYVLLNTVPESEDDPAPVAFLEGLAILRSFGGEAALGAAVALLTAALQQGDYGG